MSNKTVVTPEDLCPIFAGDGCEDCELAVCVFEDYEAAEARAAYYTQVYKTTCDNCEEEYLETGDGCPFCNEMLLKLEERHEYDTLVAMGFPLC